MEPLVKLMEATDKVRIVGRNTDLSFSIKSIPVAKCIGWGNIPDGELFTAPVKNSVNGLLLVNQPSKWLGVTYQNIQLEFVDGKIIKASADGYSEKLNQLLDIDEGARYLGEFAFGLNPYIKRPIGLSLFDEKISMSFHLAIGNSYDYASNGNLSSIHWDLVSLQTPEFGGGEIWFDGKLIRKDGLFVLPELQGLNPEELK
jgi:aminopeptidase